MKGQKDSIRMALFLLTIFTVSAGTLHAQETTPNIKGRILFDFPNAPEAKIEVNLSGKLFSLVVQSTKQDPKITELVAMIDGVYVRGYAGNVPNLDEMVRHYQNQLKKETWEVIAKVKEENERVQVSMLLDQETVRGIFVIVAGQTETIFVNIFGHINFEKLGELLRNLDQMHLDLPQLKNLKIEGEPNEETRDR